ncbi:MAG: metal ABC transporter solute-binding protein, Zn/Mn family [Microcoleaceae cyanobacterium]
MLKNLACGQNIGRLIMPILLFGGMVACTNTAPPPSEQATQNQPATTPKPNTENTSKLRIITTFLPVYMFTQAVTGKQADVQILVPPGISPHHYQATPANAQTIAQSQVLVKNGFGLETFLDGLIDASGSKELVKVDASQGIVAIETEENHDDHGENTEQQETPEKTDQADEHGHAHTEGNPHVWLDPQLAQKQVENIRDALIKADPAQQNIYQTNANNYIQQLQILDQEFQSQLGKLTGCKFIAFHDAYPYLAKRYGLQQLNIVELPEDDITPQDLQRIMQDIKTYQVKAILTEPGVTNQRIQQIAQDTGLPLKVLDPMDTGELDPQYYFTGMRRNLTTLMEVCQ